MQLITAEEWELNVIGNEQISLYQSTYTLQSAAVSPSAILAPAAGCRPILKMLREWLSRTQILSYKKRHKTILKTHTIC